jgi:hypothetical protein
MSQKWLATRRRLTRFVSLGRGPSLATGGHRWHLVGWGERGAEVSDLDAELAPGRAGVPV